MDLARVAAGHAGPSCECPQPGGGPRWLLTGIAVFIILRAMIDNRLMQTDGIAVLDGNELLIKGALEAGAALITGYPGSPVANVFDVIESNQELFRRKGIKGLIANNENQSAAILHGAMSVPGVFAMTIFKSVGAYVALDGLAITNYTVPAEGSAAICVAGDDPALSSTQVGADSRITFSSTKIPVLEPSTNQEIKDWIGEAFRLARESQLLVGCIITTNQADGGGTVRVSQNVFPLVNMNERALVDTSSITLRERVSVPPNSAWMEKDLLTRRLPRFIELLREAGLNAVEKGRYRTLGFISSGNAWNYLMHALFEMDCAGLYPVLKLGCTWPVDSSIVESFSAEVDEIIVIEEKRGFVEAQIKEILRDAQQRGASRFIPVWGKGIPEEGGLTPSILIDRIGRFLLAAS